jgi:hypothetical protein
LLLPLQQHFQRFGQRVLLLQLWLRLLRLWLLLPV